MPRPVVSALKVGNLIDKGQFGSVHEGIHPIHGPVAIKIFERLPTEIDKDWNQRKDDLLAEGQRLKDAEHERIVRVYDISHDAIEDKIYLVLEFCQNGSLKKSYSKGPSSFIAVRNWVADIALGLGCIHSRDLLHRDIKPANILIGSDGRAKLGDFGLVTDNIVLGYGSMKGYSDHIAIEVWSNRRTSIKSDIWALGMTVYRLLHGQTYYEELEPARNRVCYGGYANCLKWLPHIPKSWRSFVKKCMNDDPSKRFQNAQQVLSAVSTLPSEPEWSCNYSSKETIWHLHRNIRNYIVTHTVHSVRRHEWHAFSLPVSGSGKRRLLGKSESIIGKNKALKELEDFFRNFKK